MKLYYGQGACSLSCHIVANEAELPIDLNLVTLSEHKTQDGQDFYQINPKGYVPAVVTDDGKMLTELVAVIQYLCDLAPQKGLAPAWGTWERYKMVEHLTYISTEIHGNFHMLFNPKATDEAREQAKKTLTKRYSFFEEILAKQDFVLGDHFTGVDAFLFVTLRWAKAKGVDLSQLPALLGFFDCVLHRPAVQKSLKEEGLA